MAQRFHHTKLFSSTLPMIKKRRKKIPNTLISSVFNHYCWVNFSVKQRNFGAVFFRGWILYEGWMILRTYSSVLVSHRVLYSVLFLIHNGTGGYERWNCLSSWINRINPVVRKKIGSYHSMVTAPVRPIVTQFFTFSKFIEKKRSVCLTSVLRTSVRRTDLRA